MACPTCDSTLQSLGGTGDRTYFWCPRCGTLAERTPGLESAQAPSLVARCRKYETALRRAIAGPGDWRQYGIAESINPPWAR